MSKFETELRKLLLYFPSTWLRYLNFFSLLINSFPSIKFTLKKENKEQVLLLIDMIIQNCSTKLLRITQIIVDNTHGQSEIHEININNPFLWQHVLYMSLKTKFVLSCFKSGHSIHNSLLKLVKHANGSFKLIISDVINYDNIPYTL